MLESKKKRREAEKEATNQENQDGERVKVLENQIDSEKDELAEAVCAAFNEDFEPRQSQVVLIKLVHQ